MHKERTVKSLWDWVLHWFTSQKCGQRDHAFTLAKIIIFHLQSRQQVHEPELCFNCLCIPTPYTLCHAGYIKIVKNNFWVNECTEAMQNNKTATTLHDPQKSLPPWMIISLFSIVLCFSMSTLYLQEIFYFAMGLCMVYNWFFVFNLFSHSVLSGPIYKSCTKRPFKWKWCQILRECPLRTYLLVHWIKARISLCFQPFVSIPLFLF